MQQLTIISLLIAIAVIIRFVVKPGVFKVREIPLNIATVPIFIILVLFAVGFFDLSNVWEAIVGSPASSEPWKVLVIFFSAAFISLSADKSGIFEYISTKILNHGKGRGLLLFTLVFFSSWFLALFTSNDIVVLTITPIIFYFSIYSNLNVLPLLFGGLIAANHGIFLMTNNPADIILAQGLNINQINFIESTFLPTIVSLLISFGLLLFYFRKKITRNYEQRQYIVPVRSWLDAKLSLYLLAGFVITMILSSKIGISIWLISLVFAILCVFKDLLIAYVHPHKLFESAHGKLWRVLQTVRAMPWKLLPFLVVMFTFIFILQDNGVLDSISIFLSKIIKTDFQSAFAFGLSSLALDNLINNHAAALFLTGIFQNPFLNLSSELLKTGAIAVILATAIGGSLTLIGSLAALIWKKILDDRGISVSYMEFAKVGFSVIPLAMLGAFIIIAIL